MTFIVREQQSNVFTELQPYSAESLPTRIYITTGGTTVSYGWDITQQWDDAHLNALGLYRVAPAVIPDGKISLGYHFERVGGVVTQVHVLQDAPVAPVTPRQIRLALNQMGLRAAIETYIAAAPQDVKDSWEFATEIERTNPLMLACAVALGKTDAEIDALFALARTL